MCIRIVEYVVADKHVATINANDETITTNLGHNKLVKLSYKDVKGLLRDATILNLANRSLQEEHTKKLLCTTVVILIM